MNSESIFVATDVLATIGHHAAATYPEECCGGLLGSSTPGGERRIMRVVAVQNASRDERARRYLIEPELVLSFEREAATHELELVGFYHSHPDHPARPSAVDRDHAWPWYSYIIVPVERGVEGAPRAWRLRDDRERFDEERIIEVVAARRVRA